MAANEPEINTVDLGGEEFEFTDEEVFGEHAGTVQTFRVVAGWVMSVLGTVAMCITLVAVGYGACAVHPMPVEKLAEKYVNDADSPFNHDELVDMALATRDYGLALNDKDLYYEAIADVNMSASQDGRAGEGAPNMTGVSKSVFQETGKYDTAELEAVFANASEQYVITEDAMAHLDDVYHVAHKARPILGMIGMGAIVALGLVDSTVSRKRTGGVLMASGGVVLAAFAALAAWAFVDFDALFALFHSFFFAEGTWTFAADSLLICALPADFWMGMAGIWAAVSVAGSLICLIIGGLLRKGYFPQKED